MKLLSLSLLLSLSTSLAFAEKKTPEQYWTETGLTTEFLFSNRILTGPVCGRSLEMLQGCIAAINSVGGRANRPIELIPSSLARDPEFSGGMPFRVFNDFQLVSRAKPAAEASPMAEQKRENSRRAKMKAALQAALPSSSGTDFETIFKTVLDFAVKDKGDDAITAARAITAYLAASSDAHAHIDAAEQVQDSLADASENFVGIGANLQSLNNRTIIQSPTEGGPAKKAGVLPNDIITAVDGVNVDGMDIGEVVKKIRGEEGSTVKLTLLRKGRTLELAIVRKKIVLENVTSELRSDLGEAYGYIRLRSFMDSNGCARIESFVKDLEAKGAKGLVLDLRGNGGGLLDQAICIGGLFVGRQVIAKVKDLSSDSFQDLASDKNQITNLPLAVLIDAGSASASEVLSGALQDHKRAWIFGERSFGKATVQAPGVFARNPRIMLYRTIQRFYQPSGRTNQIVGISPDIVVPVKPDATEEERFFRREADYFPNALGAVGPVWQQTRTQQVSEMESCISRGGLARKAYAEAKAKEETADYQLISAEEALSCKIN